MNQTSTLSEPNAGTQQSSNGYQPLIESAQSTLRSAIDHLLAKQYEDGHWCAELEGDSILQSEYILLKWILGEEDDPRLLGITQYMREQQNPDGGWSQYPGGTLGGGVFDISASVKAYFVLKLMGDDPNAEHMQKARDLILKHGGAERINSFSKYYLALLGQVSYEAVPIIPPQIVLFPKWFYFHLDKVSAWSRTMIVPLSLVTTYRYVRKLPKEMHIDELFKDQNKRHKLLPTGFGTSKFWTNFFLKADWVLKRLKSVGILSLFERHSTQKLENWIVNHCNGSDGPGAIFPPIVYLLIALQCCRGYRPDHPLICENHKHLENYMIYGRNGTPRNKPEDAPEGDNTIRLQPCESPVWDTGIAAYALTECGLNEAHDTMQRCASWLLSKEVKIKGDWTNNLSPQVPPAGWFFEYNNPLYPDVDDTVMVSKALMRIGGEANVAAAKRGVEWVFAMQNTDGGWAAFDKGTQNRNVYECVPFADHNAMQDPSCPDITGRTLECLGWLGYNAEHPSVKRAIRYIQSCQEPEGCFFGRWGVNYIYGTWQSVGGLRHVGYDITEPWVQKAGKWLKSVQKEDGSFGESVDTYEDPSLKGQGPSTASQTAWGVMTLMTIYGTEDEAVQRGIRWLCDTQIKEGDLTGNWEEPWFTGTGFPKVFYLRYHYYRLYFPIMAIGRWLRLKEQLPDFSDLRS